MSFQEIIEKKESECRKKKHEKAQEIGAIEMHNGGVFGEINCAHPLAISPFSIIFDAERLPLCVGLLSIQSHRHYDRIASHARENYIRIFRDPIKRCLLF